MTALDPKETITLDQPAEGTAALAAGAVLGLVYALLRPFLSFPAHHWARGPMSLNTSNPELIAIAYLPLEALTPYARNARTHSDAQVAQIAASIKEFGFNNPILILWALRRDRDACRDLWHQIDLRGWSVSDSTNPPITQAFHDGPAPAAHRGHGPHPRNLPGHLQGRAARPEPADSGSGPHGQGWDPHPGRKAGWSVNRKGDCCAQDCPGGGGTASPVGFYGRKRLRANLGGN